MTSMRGNGLRCIYVSVLSHMVKAVTRSLVGKIFSRTNALFNMDSSNCRIRSFHFPAYMYVILSTLPELKTTDQIYDIMANCRF